VTKESARSSRSLRFRHHLTFGSFYLPKHLDEILHGDPTGAKHRWDWGREIKHGGFNSQRSGPAVE
jgi:hypothetical protein